MFLKETKGDINILKLLAHCVKSVQIRSYFWSVFSPNAGKYGPEITPYLDTFSSSAQDVNWTYIRRSEDVQDGVCKSIAAKYQNTWMVNNETPTIIFTRGGTDGDWFLRKIWLSGDFLGFFPTKKLGINVHM